MAEAGAAPEARGRRAAPWASGPPRAVLGFVLPIVVAFAAAALVLLAIGEDPRAIFGLMLAESFGSGRRVAATLSAATPLVFCGLAIALCFRAGVFNVGVEGAFLLGGLAAVWAAFALPPSPLLAPLALTLAACVGGLWLLFPGWLLARYEVDEVVSTLMLNFVAVGIAAYLVNGPLLSEAAGNNVTPRIHEAVVLPRLAPPSTLHAGFPIALLTLLAYGLWCRRTPAGIEGRLVGLNPRFARAVGVSVPGAVVLAMGLSGLVAGLGGGAHGQGQMLRFGDGFSAGYGFTGIAVALLGRNDPLGILAAAVLFGALASSGTTIQLFSDVPLDLVNVIEGIVTILAVVQIARIPFPRRAAS